MVALGAMAGTGYDQPNPHRSSNVALPSSRAVLWTRLPLAVLRRHLPFNSFTTHTIVRSFNRSTARRLRQLRETKGPKFLWIYPGFDFSIRNGIVLRLAT